MEQKDLSAVVAANVKTLMAAKNLNQTELAKRSGVSQKTISNITSADADSSTRPKSSTIEILELVAKGLEVAPWKLLMDVTPEQRKAWDQIEQAYQAIQPAPSPAPQPPQKVIEPKKRNGTDG